jgi:sialate O-acetylesterase
MRQTRAKALCALLLCIGSARADVKPAALFGDHMVIQQDKSVPVWGWADPGEQVTVTLGDQKQIAVTETNGAWSVKLSPVIASSATEMTIAGKNAIVIHDVLVGEVWLASGQSNMDFTVSSKVKYFAGVQNEDQEIARAGYPNIRMFTVKLHMTDVPARDVEGEWQVCSPATVPAFSAVGYFFARDLYQARNLPVGIITSTWGASTAQAWISDQAMRSDPRFAAIVSDYKAAVAKWDARPAATQPAATTRRGGLRNPHQDQHNPSVLWNGMIKPVEPYAIRGAIWYQGESVVGGDQLYLPLMQTLIRSWRGEWAQGDFPFLFCQLANHNAPASQPAPGGQLARVREAQIQTLAEPATGMAVLIDIGDVKNVHPKNKQDVGKRLSLVARAIAYGERIEFSGPIYQSMSVEGDRVRLHFSHTGGGLKSREEKLAGFAIAGGDRKFEYADATIDGDTIVVWSEKVSKPVAVRYGWADNPPTNLYNDQDLPASPFRTDQW